MKAEASGIAVFCSHTKIVDIESIVPNPLNPNRHPEKQIALLAKIIKAQGWRMPITISTRSGYVVKGHGRLEAARLLSVSQVPIDEQDYKDEAAEFADMIADNRIAELAEPDMPALKDLLLDLDTGAFDMDLTGYDNDALVSMMTAVANMMPRQTPQEGGGDNGENSDDEPQEVKGRFILLFNSEEERQAWLNRLRVTSEKMVYTVEDMEC